MRGVPHEETCTLCGVPFLLYSELYRSEVNEDDLKRVDDLVWASYFLALRTPNGTKTGIATGASGGWFLSGIGQNDMPQARIPPPGYDVRNILRGRMPMPKLRFLMSEHERKEWKNFERIYTSLDASDEPDKLFYLMHPCCWDILVQQYALFAPPTKTCLDLNELGRIFLQVNLGTIRDGFVPDWTTDFTGPKRFAWIEDDNDNFEYTPKCNFLARDPGIACGFDELLANPPLESTANRSPRTQFFDHGGDIFSRLPNELLGEVLLLLPSASVRDVQLSSRKMASLHLSSRHWRSRFEFPNELCHVRLPPALLNSGQVGKQWVDWRRLCDQLLHPVGDNYEWWQNRKRITSLNKQLVKSMSLRRSDGRLN